MGRNVARGVGLAIEGLVATELWLRLLCWGF